MCPVRSSRLPLGNDELRRAVAHEVQRALGDATGGRTAGPSASSLEWRAPSSPSRSVTRTVTTEEEEETASGRTIVRDGSTPMREAPSGRDIGEALRGESSAIGVVRRHGANVGPEVWR